MTDFTAQRQMMVDNQIRPSDVTKFPIIEAMLNVPREDYVPNARRATAYVGEIMPFGGGRALFEPRTLAKMLDAMDVERSDVALVVGAAYGYSTAILARMCDVVIGLEDDATLVSEAEGALSSNGADNAVVVEGALAEGAAKHGPYDLIIVEGGVGTVPATLTDQLKDGGRIACVFMEGSLGTCRVGLKHGDAVSWRYAFNASAPVLPGFETSPEFAL